MKQSCIGSLILMIALAGTPAVAGTNEAPVAVALEVLVREALENNPELKFYEAEILAAKASRRRARARW